MSKTEPDFLPTIIGILKQLQGLSSERGQPLLASILEIARVEAEDALRHKHALAALDAARGNAALHAWRLCDADLDESIAA